MVDTKTINKMKDYLHKVKRPVTPTEFVKKVKIKWSSVKEGLEFLRQYGIIEIITNGKVIFARIKQNEKGVIK